MFGQSTFNEIVRAPYFSIGELKQLFKQYQDQEGIDISNSIKDDIFMQTNGSQGLVATFGHLLDQWVKFNKRELQRFVNGSKQFFIPLRSHDYVHMIKTVSGNESCKILLKQMPTIHPIRTTQIETLICTNILTKLLIMNLQIHLLKSYVQNISM